MKRIGLKYISSTGKNFPAINGGKWNIASNFHGDFNRILSDAGVEADDYDSVTLFMRYIDEGMLICAARRQYVRTEAGRHYENIWMFVPYDISIDKEEIALATEELVGIYRHPEAMISIEGLEDILPDVFRKEFDAQEDGEQTIPGMTGSRVGYVAYESLAELEIILSAGYSPQYSNFGLILLTDYAVRVEAAFPRIFLPELMLFQQLQRRKDEAEEEDGISGSDPQNSEDDGEHADDGEAADDGASEGEKGEETSEEDNPEGFENEAGDDKEAEGIGENIGNGEKQPDAIVPDVIEKVVERVVEVVPPLYKRGLAISLALNLILFIILMILI